MNVISEFPKSEQICAIAVGKSHGQNTHCGILYNSEAEITKSSFFIHLGNPLHLHNENSQDILPHKGYINAWPNLIWLPFIDVPSQLLKLIRTKCIAIAKKNNALPYSVFHDENTFFDAEGNLILGADSNGLTCATFVKVVLKGSFVNVLDDSDWPDERETDEYWLNGMIEHYKKDVATFHSNIKKCTEAINKSQDQVQVAMLKLEKTKMLSKVQVLSETINDFREGTKSVFKRYRPEELSASSFCSFKTFPIKFEYPAGHASPGAGILGAELLKVLPDSPQATIVAS